MPTPIKTSLLRRLVEVRRGHALPKATRLSKIGHGTEAAVYKNVVISSSGIRRVAEKRFYVEEGDPFVSPQIVKQKLIDAKRTWRILRDSNFPTPSFYVPQLRRNGNVFRIIMEDLKLRYGKIHPITENRKPAFLKRLTIKNDSVLIGQLAKDLAKLHSMGFCPKSLDAWSFYKSKKSYERILMDYGNLRWRYTGKEFLQMYSINFRKVNSELKEFLGKEEYKFFMREYQSAFAFGKQEKKAA